MLLFLGGLLFIDMSHINALFQISILWLDSSAASQNDGGVFFDSSYPPDKVAIYYVHCGYTQLSSHNEQRKYENENHLFFKNFIIIIIIINDKVIICTFDK